jgi:hypothetical protein
MAVAGQEVELLTEGTHIVEPTRGAFALNMMFRQNAWHVRKGFGQVTQFTTRMTKNWTTDAARSAQRISQKWGYQKHLGSALVSASFGNEQIVSVFYCENNTGSGADKTIVTPVYCVSIYDATSDTRWEEPIYIHTATQDMIGQLTASAANVGQEVESWYGHYDTDLDLDAQKWVSADSDEHFYFQEYAFKGDTNILFFGSKRTGLMYYVPATFPQTPQFKFIDSEFRHEWARPYGESSLVQQATIRVPRTETGESIAFFKQDEVGSPDVVCTLGSRLVYAVGRTVYFSEPGDPTTIGTDNVITLPSENDVVAMADFNGQLLILTSEETFVFQPASGATVSSGRLMHLSDNVGCVSSTAITRAGEALFFVDKSGVYTYTGDLQLRLSSGHIDAYFTDYASNPLTSFFVDNGYTPLTTEQPHTSLYFDEEGVHCTYSPELRLLLITVPGQNLSLCLADGKWSFWSYTSSAYYAQLDPADPTTAGSYPGIVEDTDNTDGFITNPWLVTGQRDLFMVGSSDRQRLADQAQYLGTSDVDDDTQSFSAYILRYGRGGGIDRSIRDEDHRFIAGKYVVRSDGHTPAGGTTWYIEPWIPVPKGYVFPNGYTVTADDNVWLFPLTIAPGWTLLSDGAGGKWYADQFKIWITFDSGHWQPVVQNATQTASNYIDFILPSERVASWKAYYTGHSPNVMGANEKVQVYNATTGAAAYDGNQMRIEWTGSGAGHAGSDWYNYPNMNLSASRRQTVMYLPMRITTDPDDGYNISGAALTATRVAEGGLDLPWISNTNTGSGVTHNADCGFIPWEQWTTTAMRKEDDVAQPVDWAYKSAKVGDGETGLKARGLFSRFLSRGPSTTTDLLIPDWFYGLFNVAVASEQKGWTMQVVDTTQDTSAAESPAYEESLSENTIRTRVKDSSAGLVDKTFGTTGVKYGSASYAGKTTGTYLVDDPNPNLMATSLSVKGRTFTYMVFGFIRNRAQALIFESIKAVIRPKGGRRRRGRS